MRKAKSDEISDALNLLKDLYSQTKKPAKINFYLLCIKYRVSPHESTQVLIELFLTKEGTKIYKWKRRSKPTIDCAIVFEEKRKELIRARSWSNKKILKKKRSSLFSKICTLISKAIWG